MGFHALGLGLHTKKVIENLMSMGLRFEQDRRDRIFLHWVGGTSFHISSWEMRMV